MLLVLLVLLLLLLRGVWVAVSGGVAPTRRQGVAWADTGCQRPCRAPWPVAWRIRRAVRSCRVSRRLTLSSREKKKMLLLLRLLLLLLLLLQTYVT